MATLMDINSVARRIITGFFRLNIAKKLLLGYLPLAVLIVLISIFELSNLKRLNNITYSIINTDAPMIEASDKLIDNVLAQELYGRRYVILKSQEMLSLFWSKSKEFDNIVEHMLSIPDQKDIPADTLNSLHTEYNNVFVKGFEHLGKPSSTPARDFDDRIQAKQEELISLIKKISSEVRTQQNRKIRITSNIGDTAFWVTALIGGAGILFGIGAALFITRNIAISIQQLKAATQEVAEGRFDYTMPDIQNQDELGDLSRAFTEMTKRLKRLEEMNLDMNSLTRLPGGLAIENVLKKRLNSNIPLAFCLVDMDNFKPFNDRYGYARGNEVIQATARVVESSVAEHGTGDDFIGHIGGDDFVVITSLDRYREICGAIIQGFDRMITNFYDPDDRQKGHITGKTRQGNEMTFPIMTISIAIVTSKERQLTTPAQIGEIAAELKEYAKSIQGSIYVVDRRRDRA